MRRSRLGRSDPEDLREWRRRSAKRYEERLRDEGRKFSKMKRTRIRRRNPERARRRRDRDFGEKAEWMVERWGCDVCGSKPAEPHHHPTRGAGGTSEDLMLLCVDHHRLGPDAYHRIGPESFEETHGIDCDERTAWYERRWQERRAA